LEEQEQGEEEECPPAEPLIFLERETALPAMAATITILMRMLVVAVGASLEPTTTAGALDFPVEVQT
jgi:hypothetical protein